MDKEIKNEIEVVKFCLTLKEVKSAWRVRVLASPTVYHIIDVHGYHFEFDSLDEIKEWFGVEEIRNADKLVDAVLTDHNKALESVKKDGYALRYVKEQTEALCMAAVKQNGLALQFVRNQTVEICTAAVEQNGWASQFIDDAVCI